MTDRKKPGVAFWATVVVVVVLIPVAAYLSAYWMFVEPSPGGGIVSLYSSREPVVAWYPRLGDLMDWDGFFAPANLLDRRLRPKVWRDVVIYVGPPVPAPSRRSAITTREIVEMSRNGVSDAIIVNEIRTGGGTFDTSPDAVNQLMDAGISDGVIDAMRRVTSTDDGSARAAARK